MKGLIIQLIEKLGYKLIRNERYVKEHGKDSLMNDFFTLIKKVGFQPKHVIDVGAHKGDWTRIALEYFPNSSYTLLEPQKRLKPHFEELLASDKIRYFQCGAGAEKGSFFFTYVDRADSCSFSYSKEEAEAMGYEQEEIPVVTIDSLIKEENLPPPDILKIDAEGLDLEVLAGAKGIFSSAEVILVEAGVSNKRIKNSVLEVLKYMDSVGYRLFDLTDLNRPFHSRVLWLTELVFVRKGGFLDQVDAKKDYR